MKTQQTTQQNKEVVRRVIEVYNRGNLDAVDELLAPDYVNHDPTMPEDVRGPEGFKEYVAMFRAAFPDMQMEIQSQVAEGDEVATRWSGTGTHDGNLMGIPPTGNRVEVTGMAFDRFSGGKVVESWSNDDILGLMRQIGAIPAPEHTEA